jgi:hypothetical protein
MALISGEQPSLLICFPSLLLFFLLLSIGWCFAIRECEALSAGLGSAGCSRWPMTLISTWTDHSSSGKENLIPQGMRCS